MQKRLTKDETIDELLKAELIIEQAAQCFGITVEQLKQRKKPKYKFQKCITIWLIRRNTRLVYKSIGSLFSFTNHATVIYYLDLYDDLGTFDREFKKLVKMVKINPINEAV